MKKQLITILFAAACIMQTSAQSNSSHHIQPKIMIIPRVGANQDMKKVYDSDMNVQIGIAKIEEAFQKRGANFRSFDQALKQANENMAINKSSSNEDDFKSTVLQMLRRRHLC